MVWNRCRARLIPTLTIAMVVMAGELVAQEDLVTDRPDQTESAVVVHSGKVQVEVGASISLDTLSPGMQRDLLELGLPDLLVRVGLLNGLEARLVGSYQRVSYTVSDGVVPGGVEQVFTSSNVGLGAKVRLSGDDESNTHSALLLTASHALSGEDLASLELRVALGHSFSSLYSLGLNAGVDWVETNGLNGFYTLAAGVAISEPFGLFVEIYGDAPWEEEAGQSFDTGLTYKTSDNFQLDLAAGFGLTRHAPDATATVGFSWRIPE